MISRYLVIIFIISLLFPSGLLAQSSCESALSLRLSTLTALSDRLPDLKTIPADQKNQLQTNLATLIARLTATREGCDLETLKTDYRVYSVHAPRLRLLIAADSMAAAADQLDTLSVRFAQISDSPLVGTMAATISQAKKQSAFITATVTPVTPESYTNDPAGTKAAFLAAHTALKQGQKDLSSAFTAAKTIKKLLDSLSGAPQS